MIRYIINMSVLTNLIFSAYAFAQIPNWEINTKLQQFESCFKSYFCTGSKITIPKVTKQTTLTQKKELFFNEVSARCLANLPTIYHVKYKPIVDKTTFSFTFNIENKEILNFLGCSPAKNFETNIDSSNCNCEANQLLSTVAKLQEVSESLTKELSVDDSTSCAEKAEYVLENGERRQFTKYKFGYYLDKDGICKPRCKDLKKIFVKKVKDGYSPECKTNYKNKTTCIIYDKNGNILSKNSIAQESEIIVSRNLYPAKYFESECISCDNLNYFKDLDYPIADSEKNECLDTHGCNRYEEYDPSLKPPCRIKCTVLEKFKDGECKDDLSKVCDYISRSYTILLNWDYRQLSVPIQSCSKEQVKSAIEAVLTSKKNDFQQDIRLCSRKTGRSALSMNQLNVNPGSIASLKNQLQYSLKKMKCFNPSEGGIPASLHEIPLPPLNSY